MTEEKKKTNWLILGAIVIGIFVLIKICTPSSSTDSSSKTKNLTLNQSQTEYLQKLETDGFVRFEYKNAWIEPGLWNRMDAKLKEDVACSFAIYLTNKAGDGLYWCNIYDKMSGKQLAKWSKSWGFKVFN